MKRKYVEPVNDNEGDSSSPVPKPYFPHLLKSEWKMDPDFNLDSELHKWMKKREEIFAYVLKCMDNMYKQGLLDIPVEEKYTITPHMVYFSFIGNIVGRVIVKNKHGIYRRMRTMSGEEWKKFYY